MIMQTKVNIAHFLDITGMGARACLHGKIRITRLLWETIAGYGAPFNSTDFRLHELCWGLQFAKAGMMKAVQTHALGRRIIQYQMVYDPPSRLEKVSAIEHVSHLGEKEIILDVCETQS